MTEFLWGAATSSHQVEGGNRFNDWWQWEEQGNIETGERSGEAADHWNRYREDLRLAADLGLNSYRFSIEWSRLEPEEGKWDASALETYASLIDACERNGLLPMVTLHHFTLPRWVAARGGFTWDHVADKFANYVRRVADQLGSRVPLWCTLNEPNSLVVGSYLAGFMPPAVNRPKSVAKASRNLLLSHVRAYDILHSTIKERTGPWAEHPLMVGIAHNMIDFRPYRESHPLERWLAAVFRRFYNKSWPDAVTGRRQHFGAMGLIPRPRQVWEARRRKTVDFLGINYYMKVYVCWGPKKQEATFVKAKRSPVGIVFARESDAVSDMGWPIHPAGLSRMIRFCKRYEVPLYITENGIADAHDKWRAVYVKSHLREVALALEKGVDIRGYYHWSLLDNFEWIKGFGPRFGLYAVDYATQSRTARPSSQIYKQIIEEAKGSPGSRPKPTGLLDNGDFR